MSTAWVVTTAGLPTSSNGLRFYTPTLLVFIITILILLGRIMDSTPAILILHQFLCSNKDTNQFILA